MTNENENVAHTGASTARLATDRNIGTILSGVVHSINTGGCSNLLPASQGCKDISQLVNINLIPLPDASRY
jgi:hypothetical protein